METTHVAAAMPVVARPAKRSHRPEVAAMLTAPKEANSSPPTTKGLCRP